MLIWFNIFVLQLCKYPNYWLHGDITLRYNDIGYFYSAQSLASAEYWIHFTARFRGVHAFGYNSAECEPIWMKSEDLLEHFLRLSLADFGRDMRSSDSWRARRSVIFVRQATHYFTHVPSAKFQEICTQHVDRCGDKIIGTEFWNFLPQSVVFQKKPTKICTNLNVLRLQASITSHWLYIDGYSLPNNPSMGYLVSTFTVRINSKSFHWAAHSAQERYLPKFSATSDVRYCVSKLIVRRSAGAAWRPTCGRKADWIGNWK